MDFKKRINKAFDDVDEILQEGTSLPAKIRVALRYALENLATACTAYDDYDRGYLSNSCKPIESSEDRNKENLNKIFNARQLKSSYQFIATFDGKYQPRVIDYMTDKGLPLWVDFNEETDNGQRFSDEELPKIAKQLEEYYANAGGGASDIEIVKDNGDSVYLEEYLMEGSFDKAWEKAIAEDEAWEKEHFWDKED